MAMYTPDTLPAGQVAVHYKALSVPFQAGEGFTMVLRHGGLQPGPSSVHVLNDRVSRVLLDLIQARLCRQFHVMCWVPTASSELLVSDLPPDSVQIVRNPV